MKEIILSFFLISLFIGCVPDKNSDVKVKYVKALLDDINKNEVDSSTIARPFFNGFFRSHHDSYKFYLAGLLEMKKILSYSDTFRIEEADESLWSSKESNVRVYKVLFESPDRRDSLFFLVTDGGIESYYPVIKSKRISTWLY